MKRLFLAAVLAAMLTATPAAYAAAPFEGDNAGGVTPPPSPEQASVHSTETGDLGLLGPCSGQGTYGNNEVIWTQGGPANDSGAIEAQMQNCLDWTTTH